MTTLVWSTEPDGHGRLRHVLRAPTFPPHHFSPLCRDDRVGVCSNYGGRKWVARFWRGYDSIWTQGGTAASAIARLERNLDLLSIGIFGDDELTFERVEA